MKMNTEVCKKVKGKRSSKEVGYLFQGKSAPGAAA